MPKFSENYYLRNYYLDTGQVPTQSIMKSKMSPKLADIYFKSMTPKLKILAGLEPPMKGGGSNWYVPPEDLLKGRAVLKALKRQYLSKLGFDGINFLGAKIVQDHSDEMEEEKRKLLLENDIHWKNVVERSCRQQWDDTSKEQAKENTAKIQQAFHEFTTVYTSSITKIEALLSDAAIKEIERVKKDAHDKMAAQYKVLVKQQATMLYDRFTNKLNKEKVKLKEQFITSVENSRTEMGNKMHDINVEKHIAVEKLRVLLEYQNLACQVYVALKEREECKKEVQQTKHEHKKKMRVLANKIKMQDFEIKLAIEKRKKENELKEIWRKKVCHIVKRLQEFVKYCLHAIPEQAEFFINMEKLMLLQLSESLENPSVESIFTPEEESFGAPIPKPHPFYLFCDKGYKAKVEENLCPKHCTSSSSQLPVIIINKKCIYSVCDSFEIFAEKVTRLLEGSRGNDDDFIDDHDYTFDIPAKYTSSEQLKELGLKSSLMQLLQEEYPNPRGVKIECCVCKIPTCYCDSPPKKSSYAYIEKTSEIDLGQPQYFTQRINTRNVELNHEREPKWDSYLEYILPRRCHCPKRTKKHLKNHLPAYMRNMSTFGTPELSNYETCTLNELKKLVKRTGRYRPSLPEIVKAESKTRSIGIQYSDQEFEILCTCFSDEEIEKLLQACIKRSKLYEYPTGLKIVDGSISPTQFQNSPTSFVQKRAQSLRHLLEDAPELEEIFKIENCNFF